MNKERPFKGWTFDEFCAVSPDKKYILWITNGFWYFKDHSRGYPETKRLLTGLGTIDRYKVWRELMAERKTTPVINPDVKNIINKSLFS